MADQYYFPATDYTGGSASNALDQYDGNDIPSGSIGVVVTSDRVEFFNLGEAGGYSESSPDTIVPDTNPGNKAWLRIKDRYLDGDVLYLDDDEDTYFSAATDDTLKLFFPTDTLAYQFEATALTLYNSSVIQGYINNVFFLKGRNAADDGYVDMFKVNASDDIEVGADLDLNGNSLILDADTDSYFKVQADDDIRLYIAGVNAMEWTSTYIYYYKNTKLATGKQWFKDNNNQVWLNQKDSGGTFRSLFYLDANDRWVFGNSGSFPMDLNGADLIFDADADMKLHAYSDDVLDFNVGGTRYVTFNTTSILAREGVSFIQRDNNDWITKGRNAANTDYIDAWKINTSDDIEAGADVNFAGQYLILDADGDTYIEAATDDIIKFRFPSDTVYFRFKTDGFYLQEGAPIIHDTNNVYLLQGRNAADSAFVNMFKVNASDDIEAGVDLDMGANNLIDVGTINGKTADDLAETDVATEWTAQQNFNEAAITSSSNSVAWNLDTAQCAVHTLTENTTIASPTNMNAGGTYVLRVVQAAGVYTLSWNAVFKWGTGTAPDAPAANGDVIIVSFYSDGTNMYGTEVIREEA